MRGRGEKKQSGDYAIVSEFGSRRNDLTRYYAKQVSQLLAINNLLTVVRTSCCLLTRFIMSSTASSLLTPRKSVSSQVQNLRQ